MSIIKWPCKACGTGINWQMIIWRPAKSSLLDSWLRMKSAVATSATIRKKKDGSAQKKITDKQPASKYKNRRGTSLSLKQNLKKTKPQKNESKKRRGSKKTEPVTKSQVTADMTGQGYFKSSFDQQVKASSCFKKQKTVTFRNFPEWSMAHPMPKFYILSERCSIQELS